MENLKRVIEILLDSARAKLDRAQASRDYAPICTIKQLQDAQHKIERAIEFVYLDDWNIAIKENDMGNLDEEVSQYSIDWENAIEENDTETPFRPLCWNACGLRENCDTCQCKI